MNTPAHLIIGAAAFGRDRKSLWAALFGALLPDLSLYLLVFWALVIRGIPEQVVFNELYFSESWQTIFAIDNSAFLWAGALALGLTLKSRAITAFAGAGIIHIVSDFLMHHDDGRMHFWPVSEWVFQSPVSYWNSNHHAGTLGPIIAAVAVACTVILWRRMPHWGWRITFAVFLAAELYTLRGWFLHF